MLDITRPTQHELDRRKLRHERRHFDSMTNTQVVRAMIWRNRCPLLVATNVMTLALVVKIVLF